MGNAERAFIAYAVLKSQLDKADLYEGMMVFFRPIAASKAGNLFIPNEFSNELAIKYGLHVPTIVIESLAERMVQAGLLKKRSQSDQVALYEYAGADTVLTNISLPQVSQVLSRFRDFAREQDIELKKQTDGYLDDALFDRLLKIEALQIMSRRDGMESPKNSARTLTLKPQLESNANTRVTSIERHLDYIVSGFILHLLENDSTAFDLLSDIAEANLAAETLLTYRDPPKRGETFDEFEVFLDAPLCLDILGVNPGREQYGSQFYNELKRSGCRLNVFVNSIIEIERILDARKQSYYSSTTPLLQSQIDSPNIRDLVKAIAGKAEDILRDHYNFQIIDSAVAIPAGRRLTVGAEEEGRIREQLGGWKNVEGREVDISTCCDLIRMRSGNEPATRILKAGGTFVTRNTTLARAANNTWATWLKEKNRASLARTKNIAPLAISDKQLAGLIWITQGGGVGELARAHLVANCSAAVSTRKDVITRVYNTLITTSEQSATVFSAVINDYRAERALMDLTFADPDVVTDENVYVLLDKVKRATAQEVFLEKEAEIKDVIAKHELDILTLQEEKSHLEKLHKEEQQKSSIAEAIVVQQNLSDHQLKLHLIQRAYRYARVIYIFAIIFISLILGVITYCIQATFSLFFSQNGNSTWGFLMAAIVFATSGLILNWDLPELIAGKLRNWISENAFKYFSKRYRVESELENYVWNFKSGNIKEKSPSQIIDPSAINTQKMQDERA